MLLCILLAFIAGAAMLWIVRPLIGMRGGRIAEDHAARAAGYRAALGSLERDRAQAMIGTAEAEAERAQLARALLGETAALGTDSAERPVPRWMAFSLAGVLPLLGLVVYFATGLSGGQPSLMAYGDRLATEKLQSRLAETLEKRPADPQGHRFMGMTEAALGHYAAAARHYDEAIRLGMESAELHTLHGEMLALAAGKPIPAALAAFDAALALDPENSRTRIDRAEARFALGQFAGAREDYAALLKGAPAGSPWAAAIGARIAEAERAMQGAAMKDESAETQAAAIQGMVEGLAARLDADPGDLQGWTRLIRSYAVLGEREKAEAALARARAVFAGDAEAQAALDESEKQLR